MKIVCIADLQGNCRDVTPDLLPKGDMLLIGGDLAGWGSLEELEEVNDWLGTLDYKYKVIVAGNHDQALRTTDGHKLFTNATYLENELVEIEGLRIFGSPANEMNQYRYNGDWAFCDPAFIELSAVLLPEDVDIFLTHGPVYGFVDKVRSGNSVGSREMRSAVLKKKPKYVVCGHIHEAHGIEEYFGTTFVNAAICNERNQMIKDGKLYFEPIVIEL